MIQIIKCRRTKRLDMDNGYLNKPIRQICKNCNCTLSISNIFDFYIKKNCYADPFYMIAPYELAFKCPNCRCEVTLSGFNDIKIRNFLKRHSTDIYDLRDYIEDKEWFKYQKYKNPNTIKGKALEQLTQKLYRLIYLTEIFYYPEFTCNDIMNYYLIKEMRNFYRHKRISDVVTTKELLESMSFDYMNEKYKNINNYEKEEK